METTKTSIGKRISARREQLKLTQEQIADMTGLTENQLSGLENGKAMPQSETVVKLSKVLQTSTDYILTGTDHVDDDYLIDDIVQKSKLCNKRERNIISEHITVLLKNREVDI